MPEYNIPISIHMNVRIVVGEPTAADSTGPNLTFDGRDQMHALTVRPEREVGSAQRVGGGSLAEPFAGLRTYTDMAAVLRTPPNLADVIHDISPAETPFTSQPAAPVEPPPRPRRRGGRPSNAARAAAALAEANAAPAPSPVDSTGMVFTRNALPEALFQGGTMGTGGEPQPVPENVVLLAPEWGSVIIESDFGPGSGTVRVSPPHPEDVAPVAATLVPVSLEEVMAAATRFQDVRGLPELQRILQIEIGVPRIRDLTEAQRADLMARITL